jgi:predicted DNA-binding ribbon-helix-helix protein
VSGEAVKKRSVTIAGHRTSLSLEEAFWHRLKSEARREGLSVNDLIARIDRDRPGNLSSAVRVYVLRRLEARAAAARLPDAS